MPAFPAVHWFQPSEDREAFDAYLALKFEVFVTEQGWNLPADPGRGRCEPDRHDASSSFVIGRRAPDAGALGIVRATPAIGDFPHHALFRAHFDTPEIHALAGTIFTVNSFAVVKVLRHQRFLFAEGREPLTIAAAMMCELVSRLRDSGATVVILSALPNASAYICAKLGFRVLDPIIEYTPPANALLNMGLVINEYDRFQEIGSPIRWRCPSRMLSPAEARCRDYFCDRESAALRGRSISELIAQTKTAASP